MPSKPKKACKKAGCSILHTNSNGYCNEHQITYDYEEPDRPNAYQRGYDNKWRTFRNRYLKEHPTCVRCGAPAEVLDHIIPLQIMKEIYGGNTYKKEHYQPLCKRCNDLKGKREDKQMIEEFFKKIETKQKERIPRV